MTKSDGSEGQLAPRSSHLDPLRASVIPVRLEKFNVGAHGSLIEPLTHLLHEAYSPLAARGLRYTATYQTPAQTLERLLDGESYLAFHDEDLIGTITLYPERTSSSCEYYRRSGVVSFGQFGISLGLQGNGIGSEMMNKIEARARALGAKYLALDTSENADHLIKMYEKRGFFRVGFTQWSDTNYRSVIMSKSLQAKI